MACEGNLPNGSGERGITGDSLDRLPEYGFNISPFWRTSTDVGRWGGEEVEIPLTARRGGDAGR